MLIKRNITRGQLIQLLEWTHPTGPACFAVESEVDMKMLGLSEEKQEQIVGIMEPDKEDPYDPQPTTMLAWIHGEIKSLGRFDDGSDDDWFAVTVEVRDRLTLVTKDGHSNAAEEYDFPPARLRELLTILGFKLP